MSEDSFDSSTVHLQPYKEMIFIILNSEAIDDILGIHFLGISDCKMTKCYKEI